MSIIVRSNHTRTGAWVTIKCRGILYYYDVSHKHKHTVVELLTTFCIMFYYYAAILYDVLLCTWYACFVFCNRL